VPKKCLFLLLVLSLFLFAAGCYEIHGGIELDSEGKGLAEVEILADKIMGGAEARTIAYQIDFLFPEININYEQEIITFQEDYQEMLKITWRMKEPVCLEESDYFDFLKKEDGSFEFYAEMPPMFDPEEVSQDEKGDTGLRFFVTMPAPIRMANTTNVQENTARWSLTKEDLSSPTTLQVITE